MAEEKGKPKRDGNAADSQLRTLYELQTVDSKIDGIKLLRGELPLEVQDLEDEIEGLNTRVRKLEEEIQSLQTQVSGKRQEIKNAEALIKRYDEQLKNVRNNREFDSLSKEQEYQQLEIELLNKQIKELKQRIEMVTSQAEDARTHIAERQLDLDAKRTELDGIIAETAKEEEALSKESKKLHAKLPERLLLAYQRIRNNARNGLAVVSIVRGSCGGCFNRIPPQRQLDIRMRKKIIVCEYCGRIIVGDTLEEAEEAPKA